MQRLSISAAKERGRKMVAQVVQHRLVNSFFVDFKDCVHLPGRARTNGSKNTSYTPQ